MTSSNWLLLSKLSHLNNILYEVLNCLLLKSNFIYQNIKIKLKENSKNKRCSMLIKSNCLLTSRCSRSTCSGTDGCPWGTSHRTAGPPAPGTYSRASGAGTTAPSSGETEQLHESQPLNSWFLKHQYWTFITWKAAKWWQQWALMKFKVLLKSTSPFFFTTQSQLLVYRNQKCWLCNYYCALPPELIQVMRCIQCQQDRQTSESCVKHVYN